jgi:hypothetical protein
MTRIRHITFRVTNFRHISQIHMNPKRNWQVRVKWARLGLTRTHISMQPKLNRRIQIVT